LQISDQRGIVLDIFAEFQIGNQRAQCEIDTGSPGATVSTRFMAPLGVEKDSKNIERHEIRNPAGAVEISYRTRLPAIALAAAPQITLAGPRVSFSDIIYDCVVGVDFWSGRALTIDIANRQLVVSNPSTSQ